MGSVSMNYLTNLLGPNAPLAATFIVAFAAVLVLIGLTAWIFRLLRGRGLGIGSGGRGRQPRLAVLDYADVDQRRKLVLIRRDNVEHLLLLGGPTDVVVETSIVRGMPVQASTLVRESAAAPAPTYVEPDPPMPQPRPSLRETARQAAGEPAPARPVNLDMPLAPTRSEPLRQEPPPSGAPAGAAARAAARGARARRAAPGAPAHRACAAGTAANHAGRHPAGAPRHARSHAGRCRRAPRFGGAGRRRGAARGRPAQADRRDARCPAGKAADAAGLPVGAPRHACGRPAVRQGPVRRREVGLRQPRGRDGRPPRPRPHPAEILTAPPPSTGALPATC